MPLPPPAVDARGLTVTRGDTRILDGVTCSIPAGQCTAILGPNGCGKTTFTRCMTGQMFITDGSLRVLGEMVGDTDVRALRRRIGVVNPTVDVGGQHVAGAVVDGDLTAHEAVITGFFHTVGLYDTPSEEQRARAAHLLHQVGLQHRMSLRYALLSTGEQRRCMIARALVHTPELLILDEPTAGLDLAGREQVLATIELLMSQKPTVGDPGLCNASTSTTRDGAASVGTPGPPTVLLITHHVEEISPRTVQVLLMKHGRITHAGPPKEVITPETLTQTFGCKVFVKKLHGRWWLEVLPEAWLELLRK